MSTDAPSFPSFSSFPSPFQATRPAVDDHDHDHDHDHAGSRKRTKDAHRKKHKHRKRLHKDRVSHEHSGRPPSPHPSPESLPIIIDTKGDQNNLLYAQESKNIPDYRRYGDAVLGADNLFVSHKDSKDKKTVVLLSTHSRHRDSYRERYEHFYRALREPPKPLNAAESLIVDPLWKVDDDFVPFQDDILLTTEALLSSDPQESFATPGVKDHGIALEKTADYSRRLRDDPYNLELWLEFADLQERPFRSKGIRRSTLVERKLSIVEKALSHMPNEESLLLAYLDCIQEIPWESKDILAKWDDVLANNKLSVKLWDKYITFRMTNDTAFSVTDCIHVFEDCIKTLNDELDSDRGATEQLLAHNLTRVCYFLAQSGYTERAIACFQAMLEMTCFPPEAVTNASFTQMMLSFEDFWEVRFPELVMRVQKDGNSPIFEMHHHLAAKAMKWMWTLLRRLGSQQNGLKRDNHGYHSATCQMRKTLNELSFSRIFNLFFSIQRSPPQNLTYYTPVSTFSVYPSTIMDPMIRSETYLWGQMRVLEMLS
ncbi:hypothetical protein SeLEV6574_g07045 [Synchytrium endobioticum]|uniref:Uncharacterized protein n=1 Tax=Synchytrium endobioticum TaxID=286115 RepID=A0A507CLP8_9FUNG|nr:hypothetical protein SeLEV6574_g07045 [Synchytrium endobioticum]